MTTPTRATGITARATRRTRALAVIGATAATLAVWTVADPLAGVALTVHVGSGASTRQVGPAAVAFVSVLAGLAGWSLLAVLERVTARARPIWIGIALVVLLLSFAGPLGAATAAAKVALAGMHLAAAAVLIPALARSTVRIPARATPINGASRGDGDAAPSR